MKITLICATYPPEFRGGTEVVVKAEARALRAAGLEVTVLAGSTEVADGGKLQRETIDGVTVVRLGRTPAEALAPEWIHPRLAELVRAEVRDADLVHLHHWSKISGDLVRRLSPRVPVVVTLHDHFASCPRYFRTPPAGHACPPAGSYESCASCVAPLLPEFTGEQLTERLAERAADFRAELEAAAAVVVPSEHLRGSLARELGLNPVHWHLVPHGLCREFASQTREGSHEGPLTVLHFGNRSSVKGTLDLVQGLGELEGVKLVLAGREVETGFDELLRAAAGTLELELHGSYEARDLRRIARGCDLAAFPSRAYESYGLVIEEALALGLPVWCSERGALPEVLARSARFGSLPGGLVASESPRAWRDAIAELVDDRERLQDAAARVPARLRSAADATADLLEIFRPLSTKFSAPSS